MARLLYPVTDIDIERSEFFNSYIEELMAKIIEVNLKLGFCNITLKDIKKELAEASENQDLTKVLEIESKIDNFLDSLS